MAQEPMQDRGFFGSLWNTVSGFFEIMFEKTWTGFVNVYLTATAETITRLQNFFQSIEDSIWDSQVRRFRERGWIDEQSEKDLLQLKEVSFPFNIVGFTVALVGLWSGYIKQIMYVAGADLRRKMFTSGEPEDARLEQILQAAFAYPETKEKVVEILRNNGFPKEQIDLMFLAYHRLYDENVARDLWWRGELTEEELNKRLNQLGYTDERIEELKKSWPVIPGAGDLFHLVAKEAFEPDIIEHYGYAEEFPVEQVKWLKAQGISEYWALRYWYAHWETPSIGQGYEMLHRGVIDWKELQDLFKTVEIPPFWRDKLTEIAYMPYTRVDVRRMHKIGVISDEELIVAYQDVGYAPEKALVMADFTKLYNKGADKDLTRSQITSGYKDGLITKDDTEALLLDLGYDQTEVDYLIAAEDYEKEKALDKIILSNIQNKFENNLIDEFAARNRLSELNLEGERIELLIEKWKLNMFENMKLPSKADLDKLIKANIIDDNTYIDQMKKLGFESRYIDWYFRLIKK